jgi:CelD/BcsL family acetyltransferase involved in cellulose biosynthesis
VTEPSPLTIDWLRSPDEIASLADQWSALEAVVRDRTVLSSFDFLVTWYRHYAGEYGGAPLVGVARRDGRFAGVAPLTIRRGSLARIPLTRVDFAPNDSPVGAFLVEDDHPETGGAFLDSLVRAEKFAIVCLNGFDPASAQLPVIQAAAERNGLAMELEDHAYAVADVSGGYEKYHAALSGHYRRNLNQKARKIAAAHGEVSGVQLADGAEARDEFLARMIAVTEASYKLRGRRLGDDHRAYLAELVSRFGPRGMLSLSLLSIDGQDAAYLFGLVERGVFYDINLAYAESFAKLSPGAFLMQQTLERLAGAGVHTVVSHGAHEYKKHWASAFVAQKRVFLFAPGVSAAAARFMRFSVARRLRG